MRIVLFEAWNAAKLEFNLVAEGIRKIAFLWQLIKKWYIGNGIGAILLLQKIRGIEVAVLNEELAREYSLAY